MATVAKISEAQKQLEAKLTKRMADFESHLTSNSEPLSATKIDILAKEFQEFKSFAVEMLSLMRKQIAEVQLSLDRLETRARSNCLIFKGIPEKQGEHNADMVCSILQEKLQISLDTTQSISSCYRLGAFSESATRPILVRFYDIKMRQDVWKNKTKFKGSPYSCSEYLTRTRQALFINTRKVFGIHSCWTQDGVIIIKKSDGTKHRIVQESELEALQRSALPPAPVQSIAKERLKRSKR